jgi:predicted nucleic acid-binding protein
VIRYLLDTNVVSELRKPKPHGAVKAWISSLHAEQIFLPAVTLGELQIGVDRTRQQDAARAVEIEKWLDAVQSSFACLPMDSACFREWTRLMTGKPDEIMEDAMVAATARVHGLTVATRNVRDLAKLGVEIVNPFVA